MKSKKAKKLAMAGWKIGDAKDFLELDASEAEFVEIKLGLARRLRDSASNTNGRKSISLADSDRASRESRRWKLLTRR